MGLVCLFERCISMAAVAGEWQLLSHGSNTQATQLKGLLPKSTTFMPGE